MMRRGSLLILLAAGLAAQEPQDPISGRWEGTFQLTLPPVQTTFVLDLKREGDVVRGTASSPKAPQSFSFEGRWDGKTLKAKFQEGAVEASLSLDLVEPNRLKGNVQLNLQGLPVIGEAEARRAAAAESKPPEPTPEEKAAKTRLERLLKIRFDRRESVILKALSGKPPEPQDPIDRELAAFQHDVTVGAWERVKAYVAALPEADGKRAHAHLVQSLLQMHQPQPPVFKPGEVVEHVQLTPQMIEQNLVVPQDVLGLADASPAPLEADTLVTLAALLRKSTERGHRLEDFLSALKAGTARLGGEDPARRRAAARLLIEAGRGGDAASFLPDPEAAREAVELNLLARHFLSKHDAEPKVQWLERAWKASQAALALSEAPAAEREEALERALDLAPRLDEKLGLAWLERSFTDEPERGIEILATIGGIASRERHKADAAWRARKLALQKTAVEALLAAAPARAESWRPTLNLMALNWLREAQESERHQPIERMEQRIRFDPYGNIYYASEAEDQASLMARAQGRTVPIPAVTVMESRPSPAWLAQTDAAARPAFTVATARLHLKLNEEDKALPLIETIAAERPDDARLLVREFLRVWTRKHNPNQERFRTNPYMYVYGYNPRADGIPLTRSKQERNLQELAALVRRLRALPIGEPDEELLAEAFTTCHSVAEVYHRSAVETVFGPVDQMKSDTLATLVQTMRSNLASSWRSDRVQQEAKTRRRDKEIEAEARRGYAVARELVEEGLRRDPEHWKLSLARAAVLMDANVFEAEIRRTPEFAARRDEAFEAFGEAARRYAKALAGIAETDQSADVYLTWFTASLGACDLARLKPEMTADARQPPLILEAIRALPGEAAERHLERFANALSTRMNSVAPAMKHRYLKAGLQIAGDHKLARDARELFTYYNDLVTEVRLVARLDGPDVVGHKTPFGLFVEIRHTTHIERESGGFQKYLQNQQSGYYYNFGRPPVNYRERFEETCREALAERFEVLSVTFHPDTIESRGDPEPGWRVTPYAYLLLRARGPEVDAIPPLELSLDFLDTSGYCVLPIASAKVPLDAGAPAGPPRPMEALSIVQTLDERKLAEGKLSLEIKATARGLIPDLGAVLDVGSDGCRIAKIDDAGVAVARMDAESERSAALCERSWVVHLEAAETPARFRFGRAKLDGAEVIFQRYDDADLVQVGAEVALSGSRGVAGAAGWIGLAAALVALGGGSAFVVVRRARARARRSVGPAYTLPDPLTPFSALAFLRRIREDPRLPADRAAELDAAIAGVERRCFGPDGGDPPDLAAEARRWIEAVG
jgi:hypothetical protein